MRFPVYAVIVVAWLAGDASARLPPLSDAAKSQAAESTHRSAWADKVASYKLCQSMDRVAEAYRAHALTEGKPPPAAEPTPPCVDPGPYVPQVTPAASKPLEASGAHSPSGTATSPPSNNATSAEQTGPRK